MADETNNGADGGAGNGPDLTANPAVDASALTGQGETQTEQPQAGLLGQYIKDLSFENPNAPASIQNFAKGRPDINLNVNVTAGKVAEEGYEVVLKLEATAKQDDTPAFIVELVYAGLFGIRNLPQEALEPFLLVEAPRLLFPFARRILADAVRDGGFPPLMLEPVDFAGLYRQKMAELGQQQSEAQAAPSEG